MLIGLQSNLLTEKNVCIKQAHTNTSYVHRFVVWRFSIEYVYVAQAKHIKICTVSGPCSTKYITSYECIDNIFKSSPN